MQSGARLTPTEWTAYAPSSRRKVVWKIENVYIAAADCWRGILAGGGAPRPPSGALKRWCRLMVAVTQASVSFHPAQGNRKPTTQEVSICIDRMRGAPAMI